MFDPISDGTNAAVPIRFNDLFQRWFFEIPDYQRGYAWEKTELGQYYEDIEAAMKHIETSGESHNFGSIQCKHEGVSYQDPGWAGLFRSRIGPRKQKLMIVSDGQQRMITTLLCLRALGERFNDLNKPDFLEDLLLSFEANKRIPGEAWKGKKRQRLKLHYLPFNRCLRDLITDGQHDVEGPSGVRNMVGSLDWFRNKFKSYNLEKCKRFRKALLFRTELVVVSNDSSNKYMVFEAKNNRGRPVSELDKIKNLIQLINSRNTLEDELDFPKIWFDLLLALEKFNLSGEIHENSVVAYALSMTVTPPENLGVQPGRSIPPAESYEQFKKIFWKLTENASPELEEELKNFIYGLPKVVEAYGQLRRNDLNVLYNAGNKKALPAISGAGVDGQRDQRRKACVAMHDIRRMDLVKVWESILIASYLRVEKIDHFRIVVETAEKALFRVYKTPDFKRVDDGKHSHSKAAYDIYNGLFYDREDRKCLPSFSAGKTTSKLEPAEHAISYICNYTIFDAEKTLQLLQNQLISTDNNAYDHTKQWGRYVLFEYEKWINPRIKWEAANDPYFKKGRGDSEFEIEHIMPKNPRTETGTAGPLGADKSYWFRTGVGVRKCFADENHRKSYLNLLGNLVMCTADGNKRRFRSHPYRRTGTEANSAPPGKSKFIEYGEAPAGEYNRVAEIPRNFKHWDIDTIAARQAMIANWATNIFQRQGASKTPPRWKLDCTCDQVPLPVNVVLNQNIMTLYFIAENQEKEWFRGEEETDEDVAIDLPRVEVEEVEEEIHDEAVVVVGPDLENVEDEDEEEQDEHAIVDVQEPPPIRVRSPSESIERLLYIEDLPHQIWIEKTIVHGEPGRQEGERALGQAIWSPEKSKGGQDIYKYMRDVNPGDFIIHLVDNKRIEGVSVVKSRKIEHVKGLPNTKWDETIDCYLHELEGFKEVALPFKRELFLTEHNRVELEEFNQESPAVFFTKDLELRQGHYLTPCIKKMAHYLNETYLEKTGYTLPYLSNK